MNRNTRTTLEVGAIVFGAMFVGVLVVLTIDAFIRWLL